LQVDLLTGFLSNSISRKFFGILTTNVNGDKFISEQTVNTSHFTTQQLFTRSVTKKMQAWKANEQARFMHQYRKQ